MKEFLQFFFFILLPMSIIVEYYYIAIPIILLLIISWLIFIYTPQEQKKEAVKLASLHQAIESYDIDSVKLRVEYGANINKKNDFGESALLKAVSHSKGKNQNQNFYKRLEIIKFLLENGADVNLKNSSNRSALDVVKDKGENDLIYKLFVEYKYIVKSDILKKSHEKEITKITLLNAVESCDINSVYQLVKKGANINEQNSDGNSVLTVAVLTQRYSNPTFNLENKQEIIRYLLEKNADTSIENNSNLTVLDIINERKSYADYIEIYKIFERKGYIKIHNIGYSLSEEVAKIQGVVSKPDRQKKDNEYNSENDKISIKELQETSLSKEKTVKELNQKLLAEHEIKQQLIGGLQKQISRQEENIKILKEDNRRRVAQSIKIKTEIFDEKLLDKTEEIQKLEYTLSVEVEAKQELASQLGIQKIDYKDNNKKDKITIKALQKANFSKENIIQELNNKLLEEDEKKQDLISKQDLQTFNNEASNRNNESKILELQKVQILKDKNTKKTEDDLKLKIKQLEKRLEQQKKVKIKIPTDVSTQNHSIKKDDGVLVKRESFDDF